MKKFLALLTALAMVLSAGAAVFAEDGGEEAAAQPSFEAVSVALFNEVFYGRPKVQTLTFELRDADTGQALDVKTVEYTEAFYEYSPRLDFSVPAYNAGKRFVLALTGGEAELMFENQAGREIGLETYAYPGEADGAPVYVTSFNMTVRPATERFVNITFGGQSLPDTAVYTYPTDALIPAAKLAYADIDVKPLDDGGVMLTAGSKTVLFYPGYNVMINDWQEQPVELAPAVIEGTLFIPARAAAEAFGCGFAYSDDGRTLTLTVERTPLTQTEDEKRINSRNISSDTSYLIWVSKSEFRVRVYTGYKNHWKLSKSFPCAIGAPNTPTVEGTFKYYQKQPSWTYSSYYCGPIMRFYRGYALHSVLMRYNGTYYDGRVGVKISHGCVRMLPNDIQWMADTIPLNTTVYVSA